MPRRCFLSLLLAVALATPAGAATPTRKTSHEGWPAINGMLLMNKLNDARPLDARPGHDPFDGRDDNYRCDEVHHFQGCFIQAHACVASLLHGTLCLLPPVIPLGSTRHNELLGGHGSDTIHGGDSGDVIWGDYHPSGQPHSQVDHIYAGAGDDFIYASHGRNVIHTGGGTDIVRAHFGRGTIYCDSSSTITYFSHRSRQRYTLHGCQHISYATAATQPD